VEKDVFETSAVDSNLLEDQLQANAKKRQSTTSVLTVRFVEVFSLFELNVSEELEQKANRQSSLLHFAASTPDLPVFGSRIPDLRRRACSSVEVHPFS